jgi:cytoskeletal protein CcmA (bactofilin family)
VSNITDKLKIRLQPAEKNTNQPPNTAPSILSADLHIVGDLDGDGEVHLEGRIDGNVNCERLTIGRSGHIKGKVNCENAHVQGSLVGSLSSNDVELMETANIVGDVSHEKISIKSGAVINGFYKSTDAAALAERKVKALTAGRPGARPKVERPKRSRLKKARNAVPFAKTMAEPRAKNDSGEDTIH